MLVNGRLYRCAQVELCFFSDESAKGEEVARFSKAGTRRIKALTPRRSLLLEEEAKFEGVDI